MNETLISILSGVITAVPTTVITYMATRKKSKAEASGSELDNVEKALNIYRNMVQDLSAKCRELEAQVERLEKLLEEYKQKIKS